jgi:hypothetical protein
MKAQTFFGSGIYRPQSEVDRKHEDKGLGGDVESGRDLPPVSRSGWGRWMEETRVSIEAMEEGTL